MLAVVCEGRGVMSSCPLIGFAEGAVLCSGIIQGSLLISRATNLANHVNVLPESE